MTKRNFNRLRSAINRRYSNWLEHKEPEIARALEAEIADGASAAEVEEFARELSGDQDWFAKRLVGAAQHLEKQNANR